MYPWDKILTPLVYSGNPAFCAGDQDGDGIPDNDDSCPYNRDIGRTHFNPFGLIPLQATIDTGDANAAAPLWTVDALVSS